jgi:hypothetical protein
MRIISTLEAARQYYYTGSEGYRISCRRIAEKEARQNAMAEYKKELEEKRTGGTDARTS